MNAPSYADSLNREYERLHTAKEDAFWAAYMGLKDDPTAARAELVTHEQAWKAFLSDPERLRATRAELARAESESHAATSNTRPSAAELVTLRGWVRTFEAHAIESAEARDLGARLVEMEGALARSRQSLALGYADPARGFQTASSVRLSNLVANDPDERVRRAAWEGLRSIEPHVLANGFLDLVKARNRYGRMLGGDDFYDATVRRVEGMRKSEVFALLDELEAKTRDAAATAIAGLKRKHGAEKVTPWNLRFLVAGDVAREQDPYFPFSESVARWGKSFAALGIEYRDATLALDLVDRKGKYENGFMHGPVPAWRDHGAFRAARIQFTANAIPGLVGAGKRATETLFHEGGHAAHFANIDMPAPCFAQEFAPSSVAFAETQSMFLDSLLSDADWQARYARRRDGAREAMPLELSLRGIELSQPLAAWNLRAMLAVCYGEKAIYEIPESELTAERVLRELRAVEQRLLFLDEGSPRPILAVPHLLAGESSAYYHGYVLADMAVAHTRKFFEERDGHLIDNPKIGPDLRSHYWKDGNAVRFTDYVARLTGTPLSAAAIAHDVNRSADDAGAEARARVAKLREIPEWSGAVALGATIRIQHGNQVISSARDFATLCSEFSAWILELERAELAKS
jgi:Peptidase family M3